MEKIVTQLSALSLPRFVEKNEKAPSVDHSNEHCVRVIDDRGIILIPKVNHLSIHIDGCVSNLLC